MNIKKFEEIVQNRDGVDEWSTAMFLYTSALKKMNMKIDILKEEFRLSYKYNPIEHVASRIKTPESIVKKLRRHGKDASIHTMMTDLNDIAGIRIICSFTSDIYMIADMLAAQDDITVLSVKDYIKNPKANGYRSYHMIVTLPIYMADGTLDTNVEIQIRTIAMDFWASLEHKLNYKFEGNAPAHMYSELKSCAEIASRLDERMLALNNTIQEAAAKQPESTSDPSVKKGISKLIV